MGPVEDPIQQYKWTPNLHEEHGSWTLPAGRMIFVEMGGTSPAFPRDVDDDDTPNRAAVTVRVSSDATLQRLPDAAVRCGATFHGVQDQGACIEGPTTTGGATVVSSVKLDTESASTVGLHLHFHGRTERTVHSLGDEIPIDLILVPTMDFTMDLRRNASEPGTIGLQVQESVDAFNGYDGWVPVDADWPYLELLPPVEQID